MSPVSAMKAGWAEPRLYAWLPALLPTYASERAPPPGRARYFTTQALVHGEYTAGGGKASNPPPPRDSDHVVLRAWQAAEVRQGPRRALCAAGLHISIPPVASPRRCGRPRHGLPDPRLRPPNWRRYISTLAALIELDLGPCACFVQRFTRVRAAGVKPVGSSRCGLDAAREDARRRPARLSPQQRRGTAAHRMQCSVGMPLGGRDT